MSNFNRNGDLPQFDAKRADLYALVEQLMAGADLPGDQTISTTLFPGKVAAGLVVPRLLLKQLTFADFAAAAGSANVAAFTVPPGALILGAIIQHRTPFTGGGLTAYTISLGVAGNNTKYAGARNVFAAFNNAPTLGQTWGIEDSENSAQVFAYAVATSANTNAAAAGTVNLWLLYAALPLT